MLTFVQQRSREVQKQASTLVEACFYLYRPYARNSSVDINESKKGKLVNLQEVLETYQKLVAEMLTIKSPVSIVNDTMLHTAKCVHAVNAPANNYTVETYEHLTENDVFSLSYVRCTSCANRITDRAHQAHAVIDDRITPIKRILEGTITGQFSTKAYERLLKDFIGRYNAERLDWYKLPGVNKSRHITLIQDAFAGTHEAWYSAATRSLPPENRVENSEDVYAFIARSKIPAVSMTVLQSVMISRVAEHADSDTILFKGPWSVVVNMAPSLLALAPTIKYANLAAVEATAFALMRDGIPAVSAFSTALALE